MNEHKTIKGNKGEWSEFYAFIKILADRQIFAADENLKKLSDKFFTVLKIIREEAKNGKITYDLQSDGNEIAIYNEKGDKIGTAKSDNIKKEVAAIFSKMKEEAKTAAFSISVADSLIEELGCTQIKASSGSKADLMLMIHDRITPTTPELGFSIKSMLGSPSTLLNASGATNLIFSVQGYKGNIEEVNAIEGKSKMRDRMKHIATHGGIVKFEGVHSPVFKKNLSKIDTIFPEIIAEIMKAYYSGKGSTMEELVTGILENDEFKTKYNLDRGDYEYKIKNFLVSVALGMTPKKEWDGFTKAHGGYIVVKEDGEIVCYHLYNRDEFQNYLYKNTKLETPSTTRHGYGSIYKEGDNLMMKLNLQIRFIK
ncbi:MAG: HpaII family restriction endonuclease [Candidatus Vogelbacteria bacterium]|nr:HpaII family restriction endonuclease [Candidatus Vogelbacteria bacterium]